MLEDNIAYGLRHDFTDAELINLARLANYTLGESSYRDIESDLGITHREQDDLLEKLEEVFG